ncbi:MAG TPA: hypothetical protein VEY91_00180, partial [Candidatus Limnocylindria bacterium]|nr:hypothetical protein [Candidatus Limnocylindria bacterium]
MKAGRTAAMLLFGVLAAAPALAQAPRQDVIWARSTAGVPIVLDGVLDEAAWAAAESKVFRYRYDLGIPGSGWKDEILSYVTEDSLFATVKFLTVGNVLYIGAVVSDSSVGGSNEFNRHDGFLMCLKNHATAFHPAPPAEYLYSWFNQTQPGTPPVGAQPVFGGQWANPPWGSPRTAEQIAAFDARTRVHGVSNSDASPDTGYTSEIKIDLGVMGYNVTQPQGDILEWNLSIYDCDWRWPNTPRVSGNRTWWQGPWGNQAHYSEVRVHARPNVTISSGPVPSVAPEFIVPRATGPSPTINGTLTEGVWSGAPSIRIKYGDDAVRDAYPGVGKWRAGQFQPDVNGGQAGIINPGDATVKWFFVQDTLFMGFDVSDEVVQYIDSFDRWDGFIVSINDRQERTADNNLTPRRLTFQVGPTGNALAHDYLPFLRDTLLGAKVAIALKPGTVLDTVGTSLDTGYTAELAVVLTKLGYPPGRGDGSLFMGIDLLDGDSYTPFTFSYGTRTWWYREYEGQCCPAWGYMDPNVVVGVGDGEIPTLRYALHGAHPNPFRVSTTIEFELAERSAVTLDVFDLQGRHVARRELGPMTAGRR